MIEWDKILREKSYSKEELKEVEQLFKNFTNYTLRLIEKEINGKLSSRYVLIAKK